MYVVYVCGICMCICMCMRLRLRMRICVHVRFYVCGVCKCVVWKCVVWVAGRRVAGYDHGICIPPRPFYYYYLFVRPLGFFIFIIYLYAPPDLIIINIIIYLYTPSAL